MVKRLITLLFASVLAFPLSTAAIRARGCRPGQNREGDALGGDRHQKQSG